MCVCTFVQVVELFHKELLVLLVGAEVALAVVAGAARVASTGSGFFPRKRTEPLRRLGTLRGLEHTSARYGNNSDRHLLRRLNANSDESEKNNTVK